MRIALATAADAEPILQLQRLAFESEAQLYNDWSLPPLTQTLDALLAEFARATVLKATHGDLIVGSVRASERGGVCSISRLIVHPMYQRRGVGTRLMHVIEGAFPAATSFELFTGSRSVANLRLYQRLGYSPTRTERLSDNVEFLFLSRPGRNAR